MHIIVREPRPQRVGLSYQKCLTYPARFYPARCHQYQQVVRPARLVPLSVASTIGAQVNCGSAMTTIAHSAKYNSHHRTSCSVRWLLVFGNLNRNLLREPESPRIGRISTKENVEGSASPNFFQIRTPSPFRMPFPEQRTQELHSVPQPTKWGKEKLPTLCNVRRFRVKEKPNSEELRSPSPLQLPRVESP